MLNIRNEGIHSKCGKQTKHMKENVHDEEQNDNKN